LDYISELTQERSVRAESKSDRALELAPAVEPEIEPSRDKIGL